MSINHSPVPLITAIVATYDGHAKYLKRALDSIAAQTFPLTELEVIVVNDGPASEETAQIVGTYDKLPTLCLLETKDHAGYYCHSRNHATINSNGAYIANLDADNEWAPGHLEGLFKAIRAAEGNQGWPHFTYSRRHYVRDPGAPEYLVEGDSPIVQWEDGKKTIHLSPQMNFIDTSDFLIGKSVLYVLAERSGYIWNPNLRRFADYDLVWRLSEMNARGRAVDQVTNIYHWNAENLQHTRTDKQRLRNTSWANEDYDQLLDGKVTL